MRPDWSPSDAKMLSAFEVARIMRCARQHSQLAHVLLSTCYNGAFRVCEVTHLKVSDFDFDNNKVSMIPAKKARRCGKDLPAPVDYPMPSNVMACVSNWIADQELVSGDWLFSGAVDACRVVKYNCGGGHLSTRAAQRIFDEVLIRAGIKVRARGIHSLKHARLTSLAKQTKDPWFVKAAGRHESISMSDVYVRYADLPARIRSVGAIL